MTPLEFKTILDEMEPGVINAAVLAELYKITSNAINNPEFTEEEKNKLSKLLDLEVEMEKFEVDALDKIDVAIKDGLTQKYQNGVSD